MSKLHLGCGKTYLPRYIHVDKDTGKHIDYSADIRKLNMFVNNSIDEIYTCGTFEYFDREEVPSILEEWSRVLKIDASLRISVPNFESIVKVYLENGQDVDGRGILGPLFGRWPIIDSSNKDVVLYHKTVYDSKSLTRILESAGFYPRGAML